MQKTSFESRPMLGKKRKTKGAQFKETLDFPPKSHMLHICYTLAKTI